MQQTAKKTDISSIVNWCIPSFFVFFQFFLQSTASVMNTNWKESFHIGELGVSNLSSAFTYAYVLIQIPVGIVYDRFKAKPILATAGIILGIGCFLMGLVPNYSVAVLGRFLMGTGAAFGFIGLLKITSDCFPTEKFALMIALSDGFAMVGVTFGIILLAWLLKFFSWQMVMNLGGVIAFIISVAIIIWLKNYKAHITNNINVKVIYNNVVASIANKQLMIASFFAFFVFSVINAFTSLWSVEFLTHTYLMSKSLAASIMSSVFIGITVGGPINGILSQRLVSRKTIMLFGSFGLLIIMSLIVFYPNLSVVTLFILFFLAGALCSTYIQALAVVRGSVDLTIYATALSVSNTIIMLSAPVLQILIGALLETHFFHMATNISTIYRLSLGVLPLGMFVAFILALLIKAK